MIVSWIKWPAEFCQRALSAPFKMLFLAARANACINKRLRPLFETVLGVNEQAKD